MKVTRNRKLNVAYVQFRKGYAAKTVKVRDGLLMDLDRKGQILGIEVLSLLETAPALRAVKKAFPKATVRTRASFPKVIVDQQADYASIKLTPGVEAKSYVKNGFVFCEDKKGRVIEVQVLNLSELSKKKGEDA